MIEAHDEPSQTIAKPRLTAHEGFAPQYSHTDGTKCVANERNYLEKNQQKM